MAWIRLLYAPFPCFPGFSSSWVSSFPKIYLNHKTWPPWREGQQKDSCRGSARSPFVPPTPPDSTFLLISQILDAFRFSHLFLAWDFSPLEEPTEGPMWHRVPKAENTDDFQGQQHRRWAVTVETAWERCPGRLNTEKHCSGQGQLPFLPFLSGAWFHMAP